MITIEKRKIELNEIGFLNALRIYARLLKKHNPSVVGIGVSQINDYFSTKLKITDFYQISEKLNIKVHRGKWWYVDEILSYDTIPSNDR